MIAFGTGEQSAKLFNHSTMPDIVRNSSITLWQRTSVLGETGLAVVVLIACAHVTCSFADASHYLLNADALYIPALITDLQKDLYNLFGWRFPPASYFFPDLL